MTDTERYRAMAADNLLLHFAKPQLDDLLVLDRAEGPYVFDTDGNRYIDALSSLFCAQIGYSYGAEMAEAATRQLTTLPVQHELGDRPPGRAGAGREGRVAGAGRRLSGVLHRRRLGGGRVGLEVRPGALRGARPAAAPEGDRTEGRVPRGDARRAVVHRHPGLQERLRHAADRGHPRLEHEPVPGAGRRRPGRVLRPAAGRGRAGGAGRRPGRGRADHRRAGAERGRLDHPAARLLARACARSPTGTASC